MSIVIIDYGMGNLGSVLRAVRHVAGGQEVLLSSDPVQILAAERVVFPGQGAMRDCVRELEARLLRTAVVKCAQSKPFLGICVGAQLLLDWSEEGDTPALGLFGGQVRHFGERYDAQGARLKVPHMGWNQVHQNRAHPLWSGIADHSRFYFVHSYAMQVTDPAVSAATSDYPSPFTVALARANIFATQFHPEKSAEAGLRLLSNFVTWNGNDSPT